MDHPRSMFGFQILLIGHIEQKGSKGCFWLILIESICSGESTDLSNACFFSAFFINITEIYIQLQIQVSMKLFPAFVVSLLSVCGLYQQTILRFEASLIEFIRVRLLKDTQAWISKS